MESSPSEEAAPVSGVRPGLDERATTDGRRRPYEPRLFGRTLQQLHDEVWAQCGVCVVRCGEAIEVDKLTPLPRRCAFLLLDERQCVMFNPKGLFGLIGRSARLIDVAVRERNAATYREQVRADPVANRCRIERHYRPTVRSETTVSLTRNRNAAEAWRRQGALTAARQAARVRSKPLAYRNRSVEGLVLDGRPITEFLRLIDGARSAGLDWRRLGPDLHMDRPGVLRHRTTRVHSAVRTQPPLAIGAGHVIAAGATLLGPAVLPDCIAATAPLADRVRIGRTLRSPISDEALAAPPLHRRNSRIKRGLDIGLSLIGLTLAAPLFPLIILAIWLEDGRPFFFMHRRQTIGGREFACLKFRTMCRDAEEQKRRLAMANQCDGPQFHLEDDPRLLRVGKWLRRFHLDELPQFLNVLLGQMDLVGPRPSPHAENQFCPTWREARLSVRPGVTGLWQVARTRQQGADFQEWIRYDLQYVERRTLWMDMSILARTAWNIVRRGSSGAQPALLPIEPEPPAAISIERALAAARSVESPAGGSIDAARKAA